MMRLFFALSLFMVNFSMAQDSIKAADVNKVANLLDLKFSDKEVEMMLPDLKDNINDYKKMHALPLDNSIAMSIAQRLTAENVKQEKLKWKYDKKKNSQPTIMNWHFTPSRSLGHCCGTNPSPLLY